jgi:hypothetical protein
VAPKKLQTGFAALHGVHNVSFVLQDTRQRLANAWLIIDDQNGMKRHRELMPPGDYSLAKFERSCQ